MISKKPALGLDSRVATGFSHAIKCTRIAYAYLNQVYADCANSSAVHAQIYQWRAGFTFWIDRTERMRFFDCNSRRTDGRRADMQRSENTGLRWRPAMRCRIWLH